MLILTCFGEIEAEQAQRADFSLETVAWQQSCGRKIGLAFNRDGRDEDAVTTVDGWHSLARNGIVEADYKVVGAGRGSRMNEERVPVIDAVTGKRYVDLRPREAV
jgi:hypothetical protein